MKKQFLILLLCLLLTQVFPAAARGLILDYDAFNVYFGKTKSEVRQINPNYTYVESDCYHLDYFAGMDLFAIFENNRVSELFMAIPDFVVKEMNFKNSLDGALDLGAILMGLNLNDKMLNFDYEGDYYQVFINAVGCSSTYSYKDGVYIILCTYPYTEMDVFVK